jgi:hypothetical protein
VLDAAVDAEVDRLAKALQVGGAVRPFVLLDPIRLVWTTPMIRLRPARRAVRRRGAWDRLVLGTVAAF